MAGRQGAGPILPHGAAGPAPAALQEDKSHETLPKTLWTELKASTTQHLVSREERGAPALAAGLALGEWGSAVAVPGCWVLEQGPGATWFLTSGLVFDVSSPSRHREGVRRSRGLSAGLATKQAAV